MSRKDPYKNIKLYEELSKTGLNDFELIHILSQEAKKINEKASKSGKSLKEKPTTTAMKNLIEGKINYTIENE